MDCRVLTTGILDPERETSLDEVLATLELPTWRFQTKLGSGRAAEVIDLGVNGVRVTVMPTASSRAERSPDQRESAIFLELAEQVFDRFRPDVLLTYGGHPASLELMRRARQREIAVVFHLHNFGYSEPKGSDSKNDRRAFADVSAVIFPSEYSRRHHARLLGLDGPVIPDPIPLDRIVADNPEPQYVTFINPQLSKGVAVFAQIAIELYCKPPDIPLLVVEGRRTSEALARLPVDLSGLTNLHRMANTPDPRDFYRVSRAVLVPSLWGESPGQVPMEALANGIPVLSSDRGALPETLGNAGFVFTSPGRYTAHSVDIPAPKARTGSVGSAFPFWTVHDPDASETHLPVPSPPAPAGTGPSLTAPGIGGDWSTATYRHDRINPGDSHTSPKTSVIYYPFFQCT